MQQQPFREKQNYGSLTAYIQECCYTLFFQFIVDKVSFLTTVIILLMAPPWSTFWIGNLSCNNALDHQFCLQIYIVLNRCLTLRFQPSQWYFDIFLAMKLSTPLDLQTFYCYCSSCCTVVPQWSFVQNFLFHNLEHKRWDWDHLAFAELSFTPHPTKLSSC